MVNANAGRLSAVVSGLQQALEGSLKASRTFVEHPGARGEAAESNWIRVLQDHLPQRYQAHSAFVIDSRGQMSQQIDIVVYDRQYSPVLVNLSNQLLVPAESVYAVFEVKQTVERGHVLYAADKAASVRRLHRTSSPIKHAGGTFAPPAAPRIVAGLLAYRSEWNPAFGEPFKRAVDECEHDGRLDLGCALVDGAFEVTYDDEGDANVTVSGPSHSLAQFFLRLLNRLQAVGTVPAINYESYLAQLNAEVDRDTIGPE